MSHLLLPVVNLVKALIRRLTRKQKLKSRFRLLKKHRYPPEEIPDALDTVMRQCELWVDYSEGE